MIPSAGFGWGRGVYHDPGPDFPRFGLGRRLLYLRRDLGSQATAIFSALASLTPDHQGVGNRRSGMLLKLPNGTEIFARRSRHGGLISRLVKDIYFGAVARPVRELAVSAEARLRGIPVIEPLGAMIEALMPGFYRGFFLTRPLNGLTLWEFLCTDDDATVRALVVEQARLAIDMMHRGGLFHADLNLHNLFVSRKGENFSVVILDLDKAQIFPDEIPPARRRATFARLSRSIRKLDPSHHYLDPRSVAILTAT